MVSKKNTLLEAWQKRGTREKILLGMATAFLFVTGSYFLIYQPLQGAKNGRLQAAQKARQDLAMMYALVPDGAVEKKEKRQLNLTLPSLAASWVGLWQQYKIAATVPQINKNQLLAQFQNVSYPVLMAGLEELIRVAGLQIVSIKFRAATATKKDTKPVITNEPDKVDVEMVVALLPART